MPPAAKGPAKSEHSKERPKRKRVELEVDASPTDKVSTKPAKKLRKNNATTEHATRPSGKKTKEKKVTAVPELVEAATEQTQERIEKKVKTKRKIGKELEARLQTHPAVPQSLPDGPTERAEELTKNVALKDDLGTRKAPKRLVDLDEKISAKPKERDNERSEALEGEEEEIHLQGFSSESDSSDEEMDVADAPPLDFSTLPTFSKDDAVIQRRLEKAKKHPVGSCELCAGVLEIDLNVQTEEKGVLYLGRIPHGFYEDEMRSYFSQFGDVTRLRLSRNKKVGNLLTGLLSLRITLVCLDWSLQALRIHRV